MGASRKSKLADESSESVPSKKSKTESVPRKNSKTESIPSKDSKTESVPSKNSKKDSVPSKKSKKENKAKKKEPSPPTAASESQGDNMKSGGNVVMNINNFVKATVVNRPSKVVRSPYMADIQVPSEKDAQLCHSPALGCSGLIIPGAKVLVTPKSGNSSAKSKFSLDLVDLGGTLVGANPMFCNKMVKTALMNGWVQSLPQFDKEQIQQEHTLEESRFDFKCEREGITYFIEVKGVPNASLQDPPVKKSAKSKKAKNEEDADPTVESAEGNQLISYFPDGYRKQASDPISPRAMKHIQHLEKLVSPDDKVVCALVFVIQRSDCRIFQPTKGDPLYRAAVYKAHQSGVLILPHVVTWQHCGLATWNSTCLPVNLKDDTDQF